MVHIKNATIPFLDKESIQAFENVKLISTEGFNIKMNCLLLCAMSNSLKMAFDEFENNHTIVTEFSFEELKQIRRLSMTGSCNTISQSLLQAFGFKEVMNYIDIKYEPFEDNKVTNNIDIKFEPFDHTELFIRLLECKNEEVDLDLVLNL